MCIAIIAINQLKQYPLIILANRDESFSRPSQAAHFWNNYHHVYGGKDLKAGGSWLGVNTQGDFALVTYHRDLSKNKVDSRSRGLLVHDYLIGGHAKSENYLQAIKEQSQHYNPFNLLIGNVSKVLFYSNMDSEIKPLNKGIYGLSNGSLDEAWPKVVKAKIELEAILQEMFRENKLFNEDIENKMLKLLADNLPAKDENLPNTGIGLDIERAISPVFINYNPAFDYGTRCSSIIVYDEKQMTFIEKSFNKDFTSELSREKIPLVNEPGKT